MGAVRQCAEPGCPYLRGTRGHRCAWHALDRKPIDEQVAAAKDRLAMVPEELRRARVPEKEWPAGTRFCSQCQSFPPRFYSRGSKCRACASDAAHRAMLPKTYGIDADEYARILELQGGKCAVCRQAFRSKRGAVDHDHATGEVRGILHSACNWSVLGQARESPEILRNAAFYLDNPPTSGRWRTPEARKLNPTGEIHEPGRGMLAKLKLAGITTDELVAWAMADKAAAPF